MGGACSCNDGDCKAGCESSRPPCQFAELGSEGYAVPPAPFGQDVGGAYSAARSDEEVAAALEGWKMQGPGPVPRPCGGGAHCNCGLALGKWGSQRRPALVFLDVDGVLHSVGAPDDALFGQGHLAELRRVVDATGARIVLSSAWRLEVRSAARVVAELADAGVQAPFSATPNVCPGRAAGRAIEIDAWVQSHRSLIDAGRWIAIDDIPMEEELSERHAVTTDPDEGLTHAVAEDAIAKLLAAGLEAQALEEGAPGIPSASPRPVNICARGLPNPY